MLLQRFFGDRRASVIPLFALSVIPIVGLIGAAVDYSRANAVKASMQAAVDSTALAMSKSAATSNAAQLQTLASTYFNAVFSRPEVQNVTVTTSYTNSSGSQLVVAASGTVKTMFMGVMGFSELTVGASSTSVWGNTRLRVALVLDNTGSMSMSGKLTALKTATNNLLTQLQSAASTSADVYVSIIPFSKDVNVGASNYSESWIDWSGWDAINGNCSSSHYLTKSTCIGAGKTWTAANHNTWNGCITDRGDSSGPSSQNYDQNVTAPISGTDASLFPAEQYQYCPLQMMGLSYNWTALTNLVNQMYPDGSTDQPIGLVWGWQSLVGGGPLTAPALDPNYQYSQVIILLSDGLNTQDRWYGDGYNVSTQVDSRMYNSTDGSGTCKNIKNAGIIIYTVQVNTDGSPTSTLLQNCASDPSKFFLLTSANEIITTFNQIGTNLSKLRIAN